MDKILVTGALGQIGTELVPALRAKYGRENVVASDIQHPSDGLFADGPYLKLDVTNPDLLQRVLLSEPWTQVYHLAAVLSARGENDPLGTWDINMQSLLVILETARHLKNCRLFWPSSIAVFGNNAPKAFCSQHVPHQPTTVYGISKAAGELWCQYYFERYGIDVRSIRYPGLISHTGLPGGGTTDYAVAIFHEAVKFGKYTCYLEANTLLPMLYMPDAIRATLELMDAACDKLNVRTSYNIWGLTFHPAELVQQIRHYLPEFKVNYAPDFRQTIANNWPSNINGHQSSTDWHWKLGFQLPDMVAEMLWHLGDDQIKRIVEEKRPHVVEAAGSEGAYML
ncbi:NAD-dependent epimerase/dehydratase family protein [Mucilaginibacter sp. CAU 1740]|uniref:NAD-dependent epimerase/dehydratase family protein n=1 Tax=Mucilaginibacter sp. CAU 1740 TaxID=3140365 RepID=UPI00325BB7D4